MSAERLYTVDTVDGATVNLIDDQGRAVAVGAHELPRGVDEGLVIRAPIGPNGNPDWPLATLDSRETDRRRRESRSLYEELERRSGDYEEQ